MSQQFMHISMKHSHLGAKKVSRIRCGSLR